MPAENGGFPLFRSGGLSPGRQELPVGRKSLPSALRYGGLARPVYNGSDRYGIPRRRIKCFLELG